MARLTLEREDHDILASLPETAQQWEQRRGRLEAFLSDVLGELGSVLGAPGPYRLTRSPRARGGRDRVVVKPAAPFLAKLKAGSVGRWSALTGQREGIVLRLSEPATDGSPSPFALIAMLRAQDGLLLFEVEVSTGNDNAWPAYLPGGVCRKPEFLAALDAPAVAAALEIIRGDPRKMPTIPESEPLAVFRKNLESNSTSARFGVRCFARSGPTLVLDSSEISSPCATVIQTLVAACRPAQPRLEDGGTKGEIVWALNRHHIAYDDRDDKTSGRSFSSRLMRFTWKDVPTVAVGGERAVDDRVFALLDAIRWRSLDHGGPGPVRLIVGSGEKDEDVIQSLSTLTSAYARRSDLEIFVNGLAIPPGAPSFCGKGAKWAKRLEDRSTFALPAGASALGALVRSDSFRWYRNLTQADWSGRVDGLEVITWSKDGRGRISVGKAGKDGNVSKERARFLEIAGSDIDLAGGDANATHRVAEIIERLAADRAQGTLAEVKVEHLLEARIRRGAIRLAVERPLEVFAKNEPPFQFPTLWSDDSRAHYVDVLLRTGTTPWVVELKEKATIAEEHWHAIGQAVLYRHFIRTAALLHPWFKRHGVDPAACEAIVAFPRIPTRGREVLDRFVTFAALFGVRVVELPDS